MIIDVVNSMTLTHRELRTDWRLADGYGSDDKDVFHVEFDGDSEQVSEVIPRSAGAILDRCPTDLRPLEDVVDTDVLEAIVDRGSSDPTQHGEFTFRYEGLDITVESGGHLWIERL